MLKDEGNKGLARTGVRVLKCLLVPEYITAFWSVQRACK
jgi:hypothetical protein